MSGKYKPPIKKKWLLIPTDLELSLLYLLLGIFIVVATDAVVPFIWFKFVLFSLVAIGLLTVFRVITFVFALRAKKVIPFWTRHAQLFFIVVVIIIIFVTNLDLMLRVKLSERALYKVVQNIQKMPPNKQKQMIETQPLSRGFFEARIYDLNTETGTVWFHTANGNELFPPPFSLIGGILYCQENQPPQIAETTYQHLYGPWWRWVQDI